MIKRGDTVTYADVNLRHYRGEVTHVFKHDGFLLVQWHAPLKTSRPIKEWAPNLCKAP